MNEQGAGGVSKHVLFNPALTLDTPDAHGLFSPGGEYSYVYDGPLLRVFADDGSSISQVNFANLLDSGGGTGDAPPSVLCVVPFNKVNVLVGLEDTVGQGHLFLLNVVICKVLRSIALPHGVTSMETIFNNSDCSDVPYLSKELQAFSGIVACGTKGGQIYIIDLLLDKEVAVSPPLSLHSLHLSDELPDRQQLLESQHKTTAFSLACADNSQYFSYVSADQKVLQYFHYDDVCISSLKFLPQIGTLCVGYNFGSYQLWRMDPLTLDYSSSVNPDALPATHFSYQEPENDPRSFCYLWVVRCSGIPAASLSDSMQDHVSGSMAKISLYQLAFDSKVYTDSGSSLFKDLMQVGCALEHQLAPDEDVLSSWVVSCDTLTNIKSLKILEDDSQLNFVPDDTFMMVISWRVRYTDDTITSHFALFDINRWYHAQMPRQIRWYDGWCSYFAQYSFDAAIEDKPCLDVYLDTSTISCYKCPSLRNLEKFQYPSSLSFEIRFLLPSSHVTLTYNGLQRQALLDVVNCGPEAIIKPEEAFEVLFSAGLISNRTTSQTVQRKAVLTTLLLHTHLEFITQCTLQFAKSEMKEKKAAEVDVEFIVEWMWERMQNVVHHFDRSCLPLYDWSGMDAGTSLRQTILSSITQAKNIKAVLQQVLLLKRRHQSLRVGSLSISERVTVVETRLLHMGVVWWCVNRGLLPEVGENMKQLSSFSYPASTLKRTYNSHNSQLLMTTADSSNSGLMIDVIAKDMGQGLLDLLKTEGGSGGYPPPNIKAVVDIFLLDSPLFTKLLYFIYTMMDLISLVDVGLEDSLSGPLNSLLSSLLPQQDFSNLLSLALALWSIDRCQYEDVLAALRHPNSCQYLTQQYADCLLKRLLSHNQAKSALDLLSLVSMKLHVDEKIVLSIYLANGMLSLAVDCTRNSTSGLELFRRILFTIGTGKELSNLLCLPLTRKEMACVEEHLGDKGHLDKLVIHLLQMGDLPEAVKLNRKLNSLPLWKGDLKSKERAKTRDQLVSWQLSLLPPIQRKLLEDTNYIYMSRPKATQHKTFRPGKSFFFHTKEAKPLDPVEIARVVMDANVTDYKPFIQCLTPTLKRVNSTAQNSVRLSSVKGKKGKSVTGLFESSFTSRSPTKRSLPHMEEEPINKSAKSTGNLALKSLLNTPLVNRKAAKTPSAVSIPSVVTTPHSILKMKPQTRTSPNALNSPTFLPSTDNLREAGKQSLSRVKFDVEVGVNDSIVSEMSPKAISFNDEPDDPSSASIISESPLAKRMLDTSDEEVQFSFSPPLLPVTTAGRTLAFDLSASLDDSAAASNQSFVSADNEFSPMSGITSTSPPAGLRTEKLKAMETSEVFQKLPPRQTRSVTKQAQPQKDSPLSTATFLTEVDSSLASEPATSKDTGTPPAGKALSLYRKSLAMEMTMQQPAVSDSTEQETADRTRAMDFTVVETRKTTSEKLSSLNSTFTLEEPSDQSRRSTVLLMDEGPPPNVTIHHHSPKSSPVSSLKSATTSPTQSPLSRSGASLNVSAHSPNRSTYSPSGSAHSPSRPAHSPNRSTHSPSGSAHSPSRPAHSPNRSTHSPIRFTHSPSGSAHSPSRSAHSPSGSAHSLQAADESLRSLAALDQEACKSGLELREVREAAINKEHEFMFSPLVSVAPSDSVTADVSGEKEFIFTEPVGFRRSPRLPVATKLVVVEKDLTESAVQQEAANQQQEVVDEPANQQQELVEPTNQQQGPDVINREQIDRSQQSSEKTLMAAVEPAVSLAEEVFHFSPIVAVAAADTRVERSTVVTSYTFTPPVAVTTAARKSLRTKKLARPINIALPSAKEKVEAASSIAVTQKSRRSTKPIKPININVPDTVFQSHELPAARATRSQAAVKTAAPPQVERESEPLLPVARDEPLVTPIRKEMPEMPSTDAGESILAGSRTVGRVATRSRTRKTSDSSDVSVTKPVEKSTPARRGRPRKTSVSSNNESEAMDERQAELAAIVEESGLKPGVGTEPMPTPSVGNANEPILAGSRTVGRVATRSRTRKTSDSSDVSTSSAKPVEKLIPSRRGRPRKTSQSSNDGEEAMDVQQTELSRIAEEPVAESKPPASVRKGRTRRTSTSSASTQPETETRETRNRSTKPAGVVPNSPSKELSKKATPSASTRKQRASSVDILSEEATRSTRKSTRKTRLRSAEPEAPSLRLDVKMSEGKGSKQSPTKLSVKLTSPRKAQSARKASSSTSPKRNTRSRTSVKKPQLSPISASPAAELPTNMPRTRARRKL